MCFDFFYVAKTLVKGRDETYGTFWLKDHMICLSVCLSVCLPACLLLFVTLVIPDITKPSDMQ